MIILYFGKLYKLYYRYPVTKLSIPRITLLSASLIYIVTGSYGLHHGKKDYIPQV